MNKNTKLIALGTLGFLVVTLLTGLTLNWDKLGTLFPPSEDPLEIVRTYTPFIDRICQGRTCNLVLWSGVRNVYENDTWVRIENSKGSLKKYFKPVYIKQDPNYNIKVSDVTYNYIKFNLIVDQSLTKQSLPFEYSYCKEYNSTNKTECIDLISTKTDIYFSGVDTPSTLNIKNPMKYSYKLGEHSTIIQLHDRNGGNLGDTNPRLTDPDTVFNGVYLTTMLSSDPNKMWVYIKFNITAIPLGATIENANLSIYLSSGSASRVVAVYEVVNQGWSENTTTWNNKPAVGDWLYNQTLPTHPKRYFWNVTSWVDDEYTAGHDNCSFMLNASSSSGEGNNFWSKERADVTLRPYMNITYSVIVDSCTYVSGNWFVECSDNCEITSNVDLDGNDLIINGTGYFVTTANISNYDSLLIRGESAAKKCYVYAKSDGSFK